MKSITDTLNDLLEQLHEAILQGLAIKEREAEES
jgi:hypothetical protein